MICATRSQQQTHFTSVVVSWDATSVAYSTRTKLPVNIENVNVYLEPRFETQKYEQENVILRIVM